MQLPFVGLRLLFVWVVGCWWFVVFVMLVLSFWRCVRFACIVCWWLFGFALRGLCVGRGCLFGLLVGLLMDLCGCAVGVVWRYYCRYLWVLGCLWLLLGLFASVLVCWWLLVGLNLVADLFGYGVVSLGFGWLRFSWVLIVLF